jgi:PBP1b-binding outer membrane lipoprotein LpoB
MKKLLLICICALQLSGCALFDAYNMATYDSAEYALVNKIRTQSELSINECKNSMKSQINFIDMHYASIELRNFSQYLPNNNDAYKLSGNLVDLTKQGVEAYDKGSTVSEIFCKFKLQQINRSAETAQKAIGNKPR